MDFENIPRMKKIKIDFLDHVAIRVKDIEASAVWYEDVLGLTRYQFKEWGAYPIFMLSGKTGVALFPANEDNSLREDKSASVKIDHFAFNVNRANFEDAKNHLDELGIDFTYQDHHFFESIYFYDPNGHCIELTSLIGEESDFYK